MRFLGLLRFVWPLIIQNEGIFDSKEDVQVELFMAINRL